MTNLELVTLFGAMAGFLALVWEVVRDVIPLLLNGIRRGRRSLHERKKSREAIAAAERRQRAKDAERQRWLSVESEFFESVLHLRELERSNGRYHNVERNRRIDRCKSATVERLKSAGVEITVAHAFTPPMTLQHAEGTFVVDWGPSPSNPAHLGITVRIDDHPSPLVDHLDQSGNSQQVGEVLTCELSANELSIHGWQMYRHWTSADSVPRVGHSA